ncbi:aminotransferase class I/II-fold pyridoxal phosphate-dependent enzyme [Shewanella surugensis]|uniref:UDP-4-amino-4-deoxy-L-arabinose aminotransferase n=1 Tax=Shewanella surugensis TaxID=212020 RepID=A0ABT0LH79_9GAMM|nr:aminotransferase class I/II-fold pyridoxal phosphate-dependent enzyme [Shewanella surugensis]MCL1126924.1 UDP-4-amino-4-deoxy-L-arabinose aminotransferase [Shewanella surugensis]
MNKDFLPLCRPAIDESDIDAAINVLRSGWITTGKQCNELETLITQQTGATYAVTLSSATAGMHLALLALGIGPGDEVITPSLTWVSTINMISLLGAKPIFVDVSPHTLMTDAERIGPLITPRTKLIIPVHYAGAPLDLDAIYALSERYNIPVLEDAAHALGTQYKGRAIGKTGHCIFSLHAIKNITTAEGGIFTTQDENLAVRIRRLRFHGLGVDAFDREHQGRAPQAEVIEPGFKYNMPDLCASLAIGQLKRIDAITDKRHLLAHHYREKLNLIRGIEPLGLPDYPHRHCWHLLIVRIIPHIFGMNRNDFIQALKTHGIGAGIHFKACHSQKYYRELNNEHMNSIDERLPNTLINSEQICSLPLFPDMDKAHVERVIQAIINISEQQDEA